jgi:hypothetical protein
MSDFDKNSTPDGSAEKKKMAVAGTLATVLLGIGAFHFLKPAPQSASGAVVTAAPDPNNAPLPDETAAQAQAALQADPTAKLLRGSQDGDHTFDTLPHNPFRMDPEWENQLVKQQETTPTTPHSDYAAPAPVSPKAVDTAALKLTGIFRQGKNLFAIINGDIYTIGMTVNTAKILDITSEQVILQRADAPTGPKASLTIEPKLQ